MIAGGTGAEAECAARVLEEHPDYRVLRRLTPVRTVDAHDRGVLVGCAVDVETTGLDPARDVVIELAMQRFHVGPDMRVLGVETPHRWLNDPGRLLDPAIAALTGLDDAMLAGRRIFEPQAVGMLLDSSFVVAHNAAFDRPFLERALPLGAGRPWVCSLAGVDWRGLGFEGRGLPGLLMQMGFFYEAHRASADVDALIRLLAHEVDAGGSIVGRAIGAAMEETVRLEARSAPFDARDKLRERGYRWREQVRSWCVEVGPAAVDAERRWLASQVYRGIDRSEAVGIDWSTRFR